MGGGLWARGVSVCMCVRVCVCVCVSVCMRERERERERGLTLSVVHKCTLLIHAILEVGPTNRGRLSHILSSVSLSLTHTHIHTQTHTRTQAYSLSLSHTHTHTRINTQTLSFSLSLSLSVGKGRERRRERKREEGREVAREVIGWRSRKLDTATVFSASCNIDSSAPCIAFSRVLVHISLHETSRYALFQICDPSCVSRWLLFLPIRFARAVRSIAHITLLTDCSPRRPRRWPDGALAFCKIALRMVYRYVPFFGLRLTETTRLHKAYPVKRSSIGVAFAGETFHYAGLHTV